jgi:hypothetical protein
MVCYSKETKVYHDGADFVASPDDSDRGAIMAPVRIASRHCLRVMLYFKGAVDHLINP